MYVNHVEEIEINSKVGAIVTQDSSIFDELDVTPVEIKKGKPKYVPWGSENDLPTKILEKIRASDVMSPNMLFNITAGYGTGLTYKMKGNSSVPEGVTTFFEHHKPVNFLLEQLSDNKHFAFSIALLIMDKAGTKILRLKHKEAFHCRFAENNPKTGHSEYVYFSNWEDNPNEDNLQVYPLLDKDDPVTDLKVRLGLENDPKTGEKRRKTTDRIFAIAIKMPTPGLKYYPIPYYAAHFNSGWYDISAIIPIAKKASMTNGMLIKYHVQIHKDYFENLFEAENINDPAKKNERKKTEFNNIKEFLSGYENSGKVWYSGYYIDPQGHENQMIKITTIDKSAAGGDWLSDSENAINMGCYAMGVHPSLIGATPGKSTSLSGTDKRELFAIKQIMERPTRELLMTPYEVIRDFNGWTGLVFDIPHMMLTTLDTGKDATTVTTTNNQ